MTALAAPSHQRAFAVVLVAVGCLASTVLTSCSLAPAEASGAPMALGHWAVDHRHTFSSPTLDSSTWATCYWWSRNGCTNLGNDESQWYDRAGVTTGDGHLSLVATRRRSVHGGRSFDYRSGMVTSGRTGNGADDAARYAFTYGYVEVRFRTPRGAGLWPAIWMLPVTNRSLPEIDLLEQYGSDTRASSMTFHPTRASGAKVDRYHLRSRDLSVGWHTVGLEWTKGRLRWFLDGAQRYSLTGDQVPSQPMYLLFNLAVGGNAGRPPSATIFPATFLIDEVTVWKQT